MNFAFKGEFMSNAGLIHKKLDIKLLILYILRRLPGYVDAPTLAELCQCDNGVGYFDYSDCLYELINTGHVEEVPRKGYKITEKGIHDGDEVCLSLPSCVRLKADKELEPVRLRLERAEMIEAFHYQTSNGLVVELAMSDSKGEIIRMRLAAGSEKAAEKLEENFRENAESYYNKIIDILTKKEDKKK